MNSTRKAIFGAALLGATLTGGAVGATMLGGTANAQTSSSSSTAPDTSSSAPAGAPCGAPTAPNGGQPGPHQANGITETVLTGDDATKATNAANAAVPGATIDRVETDADGATYEAHMTKSDGSKVTVKMDANFNVTSVEDGMK